MSGFYQQSTIAAMRIPTRSMTIPLSLSLGWVPNSLENAIAGTWKSFEGTMSLERMDERLEAKLVVSYTLECDCEICGSLISYTRQFESTLVYLPFSLDPRKSRHVKLPQTVKDLERISHQVTLDEDQLDVGFYDNDTLDLSMVLTEAIVLDRPSLLACNEEDVVRVDEGECVSFPTEGQKNTHKPFANLPDFE